ncbi:hypothetical protein MPTK1_3g03750 [Marchantia polymorpha subsp. ruderalis]|uniref:Oligopeptide transporter n=2 Tax=Marchantia polymorpha TaxID=3197 RepID=A0AAF6AX53_MARPO|nr:hypothetical protein MARPO_0022s0157 [Marchantia polymorpha]BBN04337.1 hypothetical protein Mp_3g03750 [Marchantia polymorpha subsp. ruderalis]|eukprot:PTQ44068.1 hypothetical protein MARPO_0022s0157 [Marchantia polymorpha]
MDFDSSVNLPRSRSEGAERNGNGHGGEKDLPCPADVAAAAAAAAEPQRVDCGMGIDGRVDLQPQVQNPRQIAGSDEEEKLRRLNRRSQSVKEGGGGDGVLGSAWGSNDHNNNGGRRPTSLATFFSRTRSLSEARSQLHDDGVSRSPRSIPSYFLNVSRSKRIHALLSDNDLEAKSSSGVVDLPALAAAADAANGGPNGGGGGGGGGLGKVSEVPKQSPIEEVALIVPTTDDPSLAVWTFRTWTLGLASNVLLSFINTYFSYRSEPIVLGVTTALIVTLPLGQFMAATFPDKWIRVPGTKLGFSLNPGHFNAKEHALIVQFASPGGSRPGGIFVVTLVKLYLKGKMEFFPAFLFTLSCELMAFCWAGMLQKFLVDPASMWWPASLVNVSLIKALESDEKGKGMTRIQFFLVCLLASFAYHVLPGYLFPTLSGVSALCYVFKHSTLAQQLGSGNRGLGLGAFSLDYATIIAFLGSPLVIPTVAVFNVIAGFCTQAYIFVPLTYWKNYYKAQHFPLFSSGLFTSDGHSYNVTRVLQSSGSGDFQLDRAGYEAQGPTYFSAFYAVSTGLTFMLFGCILSQVFLFNAKDLWRTLRAMTAMEEEPPDVHTHLMKKYPPVPARWYAAFLLALHVVSCVLLEVYKEQLQMKWWGVLLADAVIALLLLPIAIIMATTNQLPNLAIMSQYLIGYIRPGEPVTSGVFRTLSTVVCGRSCLYLTNMKFAHYAKLPPRASFLSQVAGTVIATLVSMGVTWWLTSTISDICDVSRLPRGTPWTCPSDKVFFDQAVTWGLVGPKRLFDKGGPYNSLNYYFLPGILFPIVLWLLRRAFPRAEWISYINAPLIVRGAFLMPPSSVVSNTTWLAIALVFSVYVFSYKKRWWQRYNYVLSAALDSGTVMMAILLYYSMDEGKKRLHWWGRRANGDHCPLASCPIAIQTPGCHGY